MKAALDVINQVYGSNSSPQGGQVQLSSRIKALAVGQIGDELDVLAQVPNDLHAPKVHPLSLCWFCQTYTQPSSNLFEILFFSSHAHRSITSITDTVQNWQADTPC